MEDQLELQLKNVSSNGRGRQKLLSKNQQELYDLIEAQIPKLKASFVEAVSRYHRQFNWEVVGTWQFFKNTIGATLQGTHRQDQTACRLIKDADTILHDPKTQLNAWLNILKSRDFSDEMISEESVCRHLVDSINENEQLAASLNLLNIKTRPMLELHDSIFNQHNLTPAYQFPLVNMAKQPTNRNDFTKFYRDYLIHVLEQWYVVVSQLACQQDNTLSNRGNF